MDKLKILFEIAEQIKPIHVTVVLPNGEVSYWQYSTYREHIHFTEYVKQYCNSENCLMRDVIVNELPHHIEKKIIIKFK